MIRKFLTLLIAYSLTTPVIAYKPPKGILSQEKVATILVELELERTMLQTTYPTSQPIELEVLFAAHAPLIYEAHDTEVTAFQKSYTYYAQHPSQLQAIYNQIIQQLEQLIQEITDR